jgi:hypothetical protein
MNEVIINFEIVNFVIEPGGGGGGGGSIHTVGLE